MTNIQGTAIIIILVIIEFALFEIKSSIDKLVDEIKKKDNKDV